MGGFDLGHAKAVADREDVGQVVHLKDESGEPLYVDEARTEPVTVTVVGTYSSRYRRALDGKLDRQARNRRADPESVKQDSLEVIADCVIAWAGIVNGGVPLDCKRVNVLKLLDVVWIKEQITAAMEDHAGFFRASSGNS